MSDLQLKAEALKAIGDTYTALSTACQSDLAKAAQIRHYEKNHTLVRAGQLYNNAVYILKGSARAYYLKDGKDISDWFAFENEFVCALNCFFLNTPSAHFIEFSEPATVLEISRHHFTELADKYHDFERLARLVVTGTMLALQQRIVAVQFENAQQKYENLLKTRPDITQRVPLGHIASYLGITLETLSRIRKPRNAI